jgi:hypothetical protein
MGANLAFIKILEPYSGNERPTAFLHVMIWEAVFDDVEGRLFLLDQYSLSQPVIQCGSGAGILVILRGISGIFLTRLEPDDIVRTSAVIQ